VLAEHAPDLGLHTVLVDRSVTGEELGDLREVVAAAGARLVVEDVAEAPGTPRHDPVKLAAAYAKIIGGTA
jgi:hypothetical protein